MRDWSYVWSGVGADMISRCRPVGLVLWSVSLGQTHMLACATWLDIGAQKVRYIGPVVFLH